jgi:polyhydroxybutyrate depolymerase
MSLSSTGLLAALVCFSIGCSESSASPESTAGGGAGGSEIDSGGAGGSPSQTSAGDGAGGSPSETNAGGAGGARVDSDFPAIATTQGRAEYALSQGGLERLFLVYVPVGYAEGLPLLMALHGGGGRAKQMFDQHPLEAAADELGYVMVAPQGTPKDGEVNSFDWNAQAILPSLDDGVDDIGYLEQVMLGVSEALQVDASRRYVAGFSGGASMAVRFAAEKSEIMTAIGTFAGKVGLSQAGAPFVFSPPPSTPVSVQMTYGTLDPNYAGELKGDVQATSAQAGIDWWTESQSCDPTPVTEMQDPLTLDTYSGCAGGAVVSLVTVAGMEHTWPEKGGVFDLNGTKLLLDFFADKVKP